MGRRKSTHFLSYEQAKRFIRQEAPEITSRAQYLRWHKKHKPGFLPTWPHRVWPNFSWNDFLGTTNSFEKTMLARKNMKKHYRPYWEAVRYAQKQAKTFNLKTRDDWLEFYQEYEVPEDIPKRPWQVYEDFSIDVWLGLTIRGKLKTEIEGNVSIIALHHVVGQARNVIVPRVWNGGVSELKDAMINDDQKIIGKVYRAFEVESDDTIRFVYAKLDQHGFKKEYGYIIPNIDQLMWDLLDLKIVKL